MFTNNLQLSDVWGPRLSPVYRRHWGLAPAQTASLCPWHWNLLWNLLPSLIPMDLTHQGLSFWALSLLHTNCWPLRGLSLRQGVSWYCVWTSLAPDPVCAWCTLLTELCHRRCLLRSTRPARAGCSTLCLLSAQDSFQLIDFKFFFKKLQTFQNNCVYSLKIFLYSTKEISIIFIGVDYVSTQ